MLLVQGGGVGGQLMGAPFSGGWGRWAKINSGHETIINII